MSEDASRPRPAVVRRSLERPTRRHRPRAAGGGRAGAHGGRRRRRAGAAFCRRARLSSAPFPTSRSSSRTLWPTAIAPSCAGAPPRATPASQLGIPAVGPRGAISRNHVDGLPGREDRRRLGRLESRGAAGGLPLAGLGSTRLPGTLYGTTWTTPIMPSWPAWLPQKVVQLKPKSPGVIGVIVWTGSEPPWGQVTADETDAGDVCSGRACR